MTPKAQATKVRTENPDYKIQNIRGYSQQSKKPYGMGEKYLKIIYLTWS